MNLIGILTETLELVALKISVYMMGCSLMSE